MNRERKTVWAFGGGVQTIAILTLIAEGKLPKPDTTIMADTSRESTATWKYIEQYARPLMAELGMTLEIARHELATRDLYSPNGMLLIPAYTATGKFSTFCSSEWKRAVNRRYLRSIGYGPDNPITLWFGMSLDETDRLRVSDVDWIQNYYPLCFDVKLRRHECLLQIERFGLPKPPKSACWMCPNRDDKEWQEMKDNEPGDWQKALDFDKETRAKDKYQAIYLHDQRVPLDQVVLQPDKPRPPMLGECADVCWT